MSIENLRKWLGPGAPSPHDTELRRAVRDALIEFDAVAAEVTSLRHECIATRDAAEAAVKVANAIKAQRDGVRARADFNERQANLYRDRAEKLREALVIAERSMPVLGTDSDAELRAAHQTVSGALAETAPKVFDVSAINEKPPTPEDLESTDRIASEQIADAQKRHAGETHSDHCWARLAWGDGECECGHRRCVECGRALTADMAEERPYIALPGDVVAYSSHCRGGCQELASAPESPPRIAGKTADFDPPGREYTTGDALGLRRDR